MRLFKKMFALGLIGGSIALAFLIVKESSTQVVGNLALELPKVESLSDLPEISYNSVDELENSTREIAKNIAEEIIRQNPEGPSLLNDGSVINALDPEKLAEDVLEKQLENFDFSELNPEISISELKIVPNADKRITENYLKNFQAILQNNFSELNTDLSKPNVGDFKKIALAFDKAIPEFYNLLTPDSLASFHQKQIRLMLIQQTIFNALANYENDPLKAVVYVEVLNSINDQLASLKAEINEFIVKNNFNI